MQTIRAGLFWDVNGDALRGVHPVGMQSLSSERRDVLKNLLTEDLRNGFIQRVSNSDHIFASPTFPPQRQGEGIAGYTIFEQSTP